MSRKQGKELSMRKVREILRLGLVCQLSQRRIAQSCHMSQASVSKFLNLAKQREIEGAQVSQFSDEELMKALGLNSEVICYKIAPMPDFKQIHEELKKKSVTLRLLWEEYKYLHPSGYQYSQFCEHYSCFKQKLNRSLRQTHKAGEKLFVDYAGESVKIYNQEKRPFKKLPGSRLSCFQTLELAALPALPQQRHSFAQWKKAKVNIDYHVELQRHYYSVPYSLCHQEVQRCYSSEMLEIFSRGKRVASHKRDDRAGLHSTQEQHMPKEHREHLHWSPSRLIDWAASIGPATAKLVAGIMDQRSYPEQGYRSCSGIMRLAKLYPKDRVDAACQRALLIGAFSYSSVHSILKKGLDRYPLSKPEPTPQLKHENIRGAHYYQ